MEKGQRMRLFILDAFVEAEEAEAFMDMMTAHLVNGETLTFIKGSTSLEARFVEFIYSLGEDGCTMRLVIRTDSSEPVEKSSDIQHRTPYLQAKANSEQAAVDRLAWFVESQNLMDSETLKTVRDMERKSVDVFIKLDDVEAYLVESGRTLKQMRNDF